MFKEMSSLNKAIFILSTIIILLGVIPPWNVIAVGLMWSACYVTYRFRRVID